MTSYNFRWSLAMIVLKFVMVLMDRYWVTQSNVYYCNQTQTVLIYTDTQGTIYWLLFSI